MIGSAAMSQASSTPLAVTVNHPRCAVARLTCSARLQRTACRIAGVSATFPSPSILESAPRISISGNICQRPVPRRQRMCRAQAEPVTTSTIASPTESGSLAAAELRPVRNADGQLTSFPSLPGVYAVYDAEGSLQFIGLSRKVAVSVANHVDDLPELAAAVKVLQVADTSKEGLTEAWKSWIQEGVAAVGGIPPGNAPGEGKWTRRARTAKPEIKLTPGKGTGDLMVPLEEILDAVVKQNRVVAFIKGTRTAPQCGFSHKVLTILNESRANFEVVNVLDDIHNPGLREVIKTYSQWPTIPQLYVDGELVGGADIIEEMHGNGELKQLLRPAE